MALLVLGINHRTASVETRERVAFPDREQASALSNALQLPGVAEIALLSTCNRTELYVSHEDVGVESLIEWWGAWLDLDTESFRDNVYSYHGQEAVRHVMRVACGLDSMVLGEPQVLGQLKEAYSLAFGAGSTGTILSRLFEYAFSVAKRVRTDTAIGENPVSVAYAAVSMARHIFSDMRDNTALLIGAGQTVELVAQHLYEAGVRDIVVANRSLDRAEMVASRFGGRSISLAVVPDELPAADIVIASTGSQLPILGKGAVEKAIRKRKHRPVFMVDLAVPRDIEPEVGRLDDVFLYTVDDLHGVIEENRRSREGAAEEAENLIREGASDFMYQLRALDAVATLKQFRGEIENVRDAELDKALRSLASGGDPETLLRSMARSLTNKFLHQPTVQVRRATAEGRIEVTDWLRELHGIEAAEHANAAEVGDQSSETPQEEPTSGTRSTS
ncbi:glutamyl-tRNA reductase [Halospina denitrificans]|uniref:Glutamyl-tRNA reductase n=1 Tax=Halospina denitrificans TaxID=332522 RepID=A0A4R7JL17_9GAMM|nr:glutamyl-tRNA reductase [Halospina denitrificans]TDT38455.1 glutamyl-tRNA reductase [Halospina denitrificans]